MYPMLVPTIFPHQQGQDQMDHGAGLYAVPPFPNSFTITGPVAGIPTNTHIPFTCNIPTMENVPLSDDSEENARLNSSVNFAKCNPKPFFGDGGMIELAIWFDKIESAFQSSYCRDDCKVGLAVTTFKDAAQIWWNEHTKSMGPDVANTIPWEMLKIMMMDEYCPKSVKKMMEQEFENLAMKGCEIEAYTTRFNELATLCPELVTPEHKKTERYIWGLTPQIKEAVIAFMPTTFENIKCVAALLTNQGICPQTLTQKGDSSNKGNNKRHKNKNSPHGSNKKRTTMTAYAATPLQIMAPAPQKQYSGTLPLCNKCNYHHTGACRILFCSSCKKKGHTTRFCKSPVSTNKRTSHLKVSRACFNRGKNGHSVRKHPKP